MPSNAQVVRDYLEALVRKDYSSLPLSEDITHVSPFGTITGRKPFIEACKLVVSETREIILQDLLEEGDSVSVRYEAVTPVRRMPITEWYTLRNGLIARIDAYFDGAAASSTSPAA
jgi:ketosteroid isomerase-like protein